MKTAKPVMPTKPMPPVKGKPPIGNKTMPVMPDAGAARLKSGPKDPNAKNLRDMKADRAANKMFGMAMGGMTGKKGYAKGGMVKANCGASMKPAQKSGKK
jgi:hypothetical protein